MITLRPVRRYLVAAILLACGVGCAAVAKAEAEAAGVMISPVVLEIDSPRKAIAVTVTNGSDRAMTFQTETLVWQQIDGIDRYEPTEALLVVPAIVDVPAHASQVIRVMLRSPAPSPLERTYRLALENITEEQAAATGRASIAFKVSHNLPIMIAPSGKPFHAVLWKPCALQAAVRSGEACVRLLNAGNRRLKVKTLTVTGDGWQQALALKDGANVLAGAEHEWRVPLASGQTGALRAVQVEIGNGETLQAGDGNRGS
ncbi:fimbria/pilus periplasmic chaperone [Variovorax sp. J22R133]|uniref:fimbrial biogenesis chaperone n=1 Tax=Variovorax brevis TaxID=3053503 RepID=UPI002575CD13|nr:fimbria/pilus periplasmic chaperone [Variovorax sp. J22R133]MDM0117585.1 fimbria/pilus periplasmic chaperone [Variovorax sp. J22R133]